MEADDDGGYEAVYRAAMPSVASVYVSFPGAEGGGGAGSRFVYDADGHLVTNHHVVGEAGETVELRVVRGGRETSERVRLEARPAPDGGADGRRRLRGR